MLANAGRVLAGALAALVSWPAAAAQRQETVIYSRFDLDSGERRRFDFPSKEHNARLDVRFEVLTEDAPGVRVGVLREQAPLAAAEDARRRPNAYQRDGRWRARLPQPGGYTVYIDRREDGRRKIRVELDVTVTTGPDPETLPVAYASPRKRRIVIAVSLAGFLLIAGWSGRALWRAAQRRPEPPAAPFGGWV